MDGIEMGHAPREYRRWGVFWNGDLYGSLRLLFKTRSECRAHIEQEFGYIRKRADLRGPPFNWRMPKAVRVTVRVSAPPDTRG